MTTGDIIIHSAKGSTWKVHKYLKKVGKRYIYDESGLRKKSGGLTYSEKSNSTRARLGRTTRKKTVSGVISRGVHRRVADDKTKEFYGVDYQPSYGLPDPALYDGSPEDREKFFKQYYELEGKVEQYRAKKGKEIIKRIMQHDRQESYQRKQKSIAKYANDIAKKREKEQKLDKIKAAAAKGAQMYNKRVQQEKKREKMASTIKNSQMYKKTHSR